MLIIELLPDFSYLFCSPYQTGHDIELSPYLEREVVARADNQWTLHGWCLLPQYQIQCCQVNQEKRDIQVCIHPCTVHWLSNPLFIDKWQILLYIIFLTFYFWNFRTSIIGVIIDSVKHILTTRLKSQHVIKFL